MAAQVANDAALAALCGDIARTLDADYIQRVFGRQLAGTADRFFQTELNNSLRFLRTQKKQACVQGFQQFLAEGCKAFIAKHRISSARYNQEVQMTVYAALKREKIPSEIVVQIRRDSDLYGMIDSAVRSVLEAVYQKRVREYGIKQLKKDVAAHNKLALALAAA